MSDIQRSTSDSSAQSTPWLVLAGMLLLSVIAAGYVWQTGRIAADNQYKYSVETSAHEIRDTIHDRIDEYVGLLRGAAGLFAADGPVSSQQFHEYVQRLDLPTDYPGVWGIGYSVVAAPGQAQSIEAKRQAQGLKNFHIWPAPKPGAPVSAVVYLEPPDPANQAMVGYDLASDPACREAMDRARDTGAPAASTKVANQPATAPAARKNDFIIFVPLYRGGVDPGVVAARRANLLGFVYCPFTADLLLRGIGHGLHGALIDFTVYDGSIQAPEFHLHHTGVQTTAGAGAPIQSQQMVVAGRIWTLAFRARPDLAPKPSAALPVAVFIVGAMFAGLMYWIISSQARARVASERSATELRRSQAALEQSEASLRRLVESNLIGVVITDSAGRIVQANNAFLSITGYSRQDLLEGKMTRASLARSDGADQDASGMGQLLEAASQTPYEKEYVRQDGSSVPVLVGTTTLHQDQNTAVSFVVDLSELRKARSAVAESERRFRMLVEQSPLGIQVFAPDGHVLLANRAWESLWQSGPADLGEYNVLSDPQLEKIGLRPLLTRAFAGEFAEMPPFRYDPALSGRPGRPRWVQFHFYPVKDHAGVVREIVLILHDLTEVKEAEEAVARSEEQLRLVIDALPMLIAYLDHEARFRMSNQLYQEWFDLPEGQAEGMPLRQVIGEEAYRIAAPHLERALAGERQAYDRKMRFLDETEHDLHVTLIPHVGLAGHVEGVVALVADVTERRQAENERGRLLAAEREARAEAETANRIKDEFLATLSHELRTPLNAILGWAQLLRMGSLPADEVSHGLEAIERNAKVQAQLVEDLLDLSRIISGKLRLEMRPVDVPALLDAALDSVRPAAQAKGIELVPRFDPEAGPVLGDAGRLQQVIWNLLSNAIKFTPTGGKVELLLNKVRSDAQVVVRDTGIGIAPEFLPFVFDRLRQADSTTTRRHGGLGLGLAIARHLIESHGGSISVHSEGENRGAAFTVSLPLVLNAAPKEIRAKDGDGQGEPAALKRSLDGVRVLVVDDEADARDLVSQVLRRDGAEVRSAGSAAEALSAVDELHPDVLVSDIAMPGEDGYELIRKIRLRDPSHGGRLPAIALTAFARGEDRERALRAGFQAHMAKPFEPLQLTAAVAKLAKD